MLSRLVLTLLFMLAVACIHGLLASRIISIYTFTMIRIQGNLIAGADLTPFALKTVTFRLVIVTRRTVDYRSIIDLRNLLQAMSVARSGTNLGIRKVATAGIRLLRIDLDKMRALLGVRFDSFTIHS